MPKLIKNRQLHENQWHLARNAEDIQSGEKLIVPVDLYKEHLPQLGDKFKNKDLGLLLESHQGVEDLPEGFEQLPVIAIDFPTFTDGRGYSIARDILRYTAFKGELRAVGDVLPDQLHAMERCGFNAFELVNEADPDKAISLFDVFSSKYQSDELEKRPVYNR